MRVLMINSVSGIKSTGRICTDLASELLSNGHEVKVAYARGIVPDKYKSISIRIGSDFDVYKQAIMTRVFDTEGLGNKKATIEFLNWVKQYNPDVIHLHNIHGYYINYELLFDFLKSFGRPVIWTLHDCWSITGHCAHFDYVDCQKWKCECFDCPLKKEYPKSIFVDNSKQNYKRKMKAFTGVPNLVLVSPSEWLKTFIKDSYMKNYSTVVIKNGINVDVFKPKNSNVKNMLGIKNKMILGVASAWSHRKGLDEFVSLYKLLPEEFFTIVLVGLTEKQIKKMPKGIKCISLTNSVDELAAFYSAADIFVNPTLEDNYPTTNLEAIACGTPVITYRTGGSPESANSFGITINRDVQELANAIITFVEPERREIDLDYRDCVRKYIQLYSDMINDNSNIDYEDNL